jgi:hypothetical protein
MSDETDNRFEESMADDLAINRDFTHPRALCPSCGIPTIEDREGLTIEERLCESCYAGNCQGCHMVPINDAADELCAECATGAAESMEER